MTEPAPPSSLPVVRVPARPGPPLRFQLRPVAPSLRSFLATEAGGAVLLLAATVVALVWANSAWSGAYDALWSTEAGWRVGPWAFEMDLHHWVNDAAMAVFFLVIGLEINREVTSGELRNRRTVAVPALGALGGLAVPALIYVAFNAGSPAEHGWGIVMSTDTAFLVGILALFGPRCPDQLRLFLLTLAVVDDIGAITVMALFYTDDLWLPGLLVAAVLVVVILVLRWLGVWRLAPYALAGIALWGAVYASGVHATLAGVLVGLLVPSRSSRPVDVAVVPKYAKRLAQETTAEREHLTELAARAAVPTSERLQRVLHPWSAYVVVPVFGLANAGVQLDGESLRAAATSPVTIGVAVALVVGNAVGIFGAATLALRLGLGDLPGRVRYSHLLGGAILAGIGFTISLFIAELAFDDEALVEQAKIGILAGLARRRRARVRRAPAVRRALAPVLARRGRPAARAPAAPLAPARDHVTARPSARHGTPRVRVWSPPGRPDPASALRPRGGGDGGPQALRGDAPAVADAVDEERRGALHADRERVGVVALHRRGVLLGRVPDDRRAVEPELLGPLGEPGLAELVLVREQRGLHLPEPALRGGRLDGERGRQRVRVDLEQREVAEHETHPAAGGLDDLPQHRGGGGAVRALEVAELDDGDGRGRVPEDARVGGDELLGRDAVGSLLAHAAQHGTGAAPVVRRARAVGSPGPRPARAPRDARGPGPRCRATRRGSARGARRPTRGRR